MKEIRKLTCIGCPLGCQMEVEMEADTVLAVAGNTCPRGEAYARRELCAPARTLTSTVALKNSRNGAKRLPCKTRAEVPKDSLFACMRALSECVVEAPVQLGDLILRDIAGTGVDVVATKTVR